MPNKLEDLAELLDKLADDEQPIPTSQLFHISDLAGDPMRLFWATWETLQVEQRRKLARSLAELAEASFEVNYDAIFVRFLDDPDEEVRSTAIDGLWENQEQNLIGPLIAKLRSDPAPRVRASAAQSLGRYVLMGELEELEDTIHNRIVTELLTVLHLADESLQVRRRALESVAYACSAETLEAIEAAYYDDDVEMRLSAVVGMGRSCDKRWTKVAMEELSSEFAAMRYEAAMACGELGLSQAVPALTRMVDDADREVGGAAIWSLGQIGGAQAKEALLDASEDASGDTAVAIEEALAELVLLEGELEFDLYGLAQGLEGDLDQELTALWIAEHQDEEADDWD